MGRAGRVAWAPAGSHPPVSLLGLTSGDSSRSTPVAASYRAATTTDAYVCMRWNAVSFASMLTGASITRLDPWPIVEGPDRCPLRRGKAYPVGLEHGPQRGH